MVILGVTGSVGRQTVEVCRHLGLAVTAIACRTPGRAILEMAAEVPEAEVIITGATSGERDEMTGALGRRVRFGGEAMLEAASVPGRTVVNAVVGAAGLRATLATVEAGNRLALANKESLVVAGRLVTTVARRCGAEIVPVDSEHSALFQLVTGSDVTRLILTASGGPFRGRSREQLEDATVEEALAHPTWNMGRRISIDSATLVNKGMEVIEAHHLFGMDYDRIEVVVHPQSVVHSLVELEDGAMLAHLGVTDMRVPIQYALTHPRRLAPPVERFSLIGRSLEFEAPDVQTFPGLALAYQAGRAGDRATAAYNAADEVAVEGFLNRRIGFLSIDEIIMRTVEAIGGGEVESFEEAMEVDAEARSLAAGWLSGAC